MDTIIAIVKLIFMAIYLVMSGIEKDINKKNYYMLWAILFAV